MKTKKIYRKKRNTTKKKYFKHNIDYSFLKKLTAVHAPSGEEDRVVEFIVNYVKKNKHKWKHAPKIFHGGKYKNNIILVFGKPRVAIFSHLDSVGFMVNYHNILYKIGGPNFKNGTKLIGYDHHGKVNAKLISRNNLKRKNKKITYKSKRKVDIGTNLTYLQNWKETRNTVQTCSLDNRLGSFISLKLAETLENGILIFTASEETSGGDISFLADTIYKKYKVRRALISDIIPTSKSIRMGNGAVISFRDINIPRRSFINEVIKNSENFKYQLEVANKGGTDGEGLIYSPAPFDFCQVATAISNYHSPREKANKQDIVETIKLYKHLMKKL
ncbi:MAG: aminopeptidase [Magnetovibrio sp.]|nr:aminopeptidase [Magnetovibrio sp.]|tara:strand:- start:3080 stop:4072 length:993 start_codon:yes stop_codon:yes gene_type:complete